jgi:hypothetical protein
MSSNNDEIQNLFTILLDSVLTKVSNSYKIKLDELKASIGTITFTENLSDSINSFCSILNPLEAPKPKRVLKKTIQTSKESETVSEPEVAVEAPKPKKVLKKAVIATEAPKELEVSVEASKEPEVSVEAPKPKKVLKKAVKVSESPKEPEVVVEPPNHPEVSVEAPKPKKVLKKPVKFAESPKEPEVNVEAPNHPEVSVEAPKLKKVLKKAVPALETPNEPEVVVQEPEVKIKPKKIIIKRQAIEPATIVAPQKKSIKEVDVVEYGSDEQHDENATVYDSIQMYEDDLLEPREINGVKYLIDSSEYIYDMESQELLGKLSEKDKNTILFLKNFTE